MVNLTSYHWTIAKWVLMYLKGTIDFGRIYEKGVKDIKVIGYGDSDFADHVEDRKSTSGQVFLLGGLPITWNCLKQKVVALSTCGIYSNYTSHILGSVDCKVSKGGNVARH